ncbi:LysR family transcriptional regulator [Sneathiella marina]|uniref:LysR family transcriptional regulator n=1 Tax=Sneathiella marina TaxID=2950108 RepID=A0ABY4WBJ4_9PROT|nr:LysR family transcriptional regulator [Sneathiella marina]USG62036.1 LysR family transcriptional regulator [Sneathiella marina]
MTYEQLVVLHAIVTEGTFRGAADRLNKSQSAVSHMLKKLETEIDIVLLSREEYRPKLTAAGEVFYRQATRVMQQMQELGSTAKNLSAKQEAQVFLAVTATYPLKPLLEIVGALTAEYPATHIRLSGESMGGPLERLLRQEADIIIATMDGVPVEQVEAIPFAEVIILPVAHPDFEPAQSSHMKTVSEMQSYTQVVVADSSSGAFAQSRDLLPGGLRWTVSDFAAKKEILIAKMGWGGMPTHMIEKELERGELVALNVEDYPPRQSHLFQIRKRDRDVGIVAQSIWQQLKSLRS